MAEEDGQMGGVDWGFTVEDWQSALEERTARRASRQHAAANEFAKWHFGGGECARGNGRMAQKQSLTD